MKIGDTVKIEDTEEIGTIRWIANGRYYVVDRFEIEHAFWEHQLTLVEIKSEDAYEK